MGLVDADRVDRQNRVEPIGKPRALDKRSQHRRRAVGEDGGPKSRLAQRAEDRWNLGERVEAEIELHQPVA